LLNTLGGDGDVVAETYCELGRMIGSLI